MKRGDEKQGDTLHGLVTKVLIERLEQKDVNDINPRDIDLALKFLAANGITRFIGDDEVSSAEVKDEMGKFKPPHMPDPKEWEDEEATG